VASVDPDVDDLDRGFDSSVHFPEPLDLIISERLQAAGAGWQ
jgi:hypothetical protein